MKTACTKPCNECPFRRKSLPGYLGNSTTAEFITATLRDVAMPCHKTVDYEDPEWRHQVTPNGDASQCAGAAIFFANIGKLSRDTSRFKFPPDRENVFVGPQEFIDHHAKMNAQVLGGPALKSLSYGPIYEPVYERLDLGAKPMKKRTSKAKRAKRTTGAKR